MAGLAWLALTQFETTVSSPGKKVEVSFAIDYEAKIAALEPKVG